MENESGTREQILHHIHAARTNAEAKASALRRRNTRLVTLGLFTSGLGTILAGFAAAAGPLGGKGTGAWKMTCGIIAALTACATLLAGLNQQLSIPDRLARATACAGRLRALEVEITVAHRNPTEVAEQYEQVLRADPEFTSW
jgi:hypothetical protein